MGQHCSCTKRQAELDSKVELRLKRKNNRTTYRPKGAQYICPQIKDRYTTWTPSEGGLGNHKREIKV